MTPARSSRSAPRPTTTGHDHFPSRGSIRRSPGRLPGRYARRIPRLQHVHPDRHPDRSATAPAAAGSEVLAAAGHGGIHGPGRGTAPHHGGGGCRRGRWRGGGLRHRRDARRGEDRPGCARRPSAAAPLPGPAAVHRPALPYPRAGSGIPGGGASRVADSRRRRRPQPAPGYAGPGWPVAGPDGWAAGAACLGQRRQQRPGHATAARG